MKKGRFTGKVVTVTGGASGIGKNIARQFGNEGALVIICDIDKIKGREAALELRKQGIATNFLYVDLGKRGAAQKMVKQIVSRWKKLDILVNNACFKHRTDLFGEDEKTWEDGISVTLRAAFFSSREAIRVMSRTGGGSIVNISSVLAILTCYESPIYQIAKAGLLQMTRYLAAYAGRFGVRVNSVLPGFIIKDEDRERYNKADNRRYRKIAEFCHPLGCIGGSNDIANAVLFFCSQESSFITGQCLIVDGGSTLQEQSSLVSRFDKEAHKT